MTDERSPEDRLRAIHALHDDGLISDEEFNEKRGDLIKEIGKRPTPPPSTPKRKRSLSSQPLELESKSKRSGGLGCLLVIVVLIAGCVAITNMDGLDTLSDIDRIDIDALSANGASSDVSTQTAVAVVDSTMLGDSWIGSGTYSIVAASKSHSDGGGFTAYAAKINAPGADGLCLYWREDDSGLLIGDTVTRKFSDWGSEVPATAPAAQEVKASMSSPEGRAVRSDVGC